MNHRYRVIRSIEECETLETGYEHQYALKYSTDQDSRFIWIKSPYSYYVMSALVAFIQYKSTEIDKRFIITHDQVCEVLCSFYNCEISSRPLNNASEIDLYMSSEEFVGTSLLEIDKFQRGDLNALLHCYIDSWRTL